MKRAVWWAIVLCAALAIPMLVQISFAKTYENVPVETPSGPTCHYRHLDRVGKMGRGPIELPQPPPVPYTEGRVAGTNAKGGENPMAAGASPRAGGMTRAQKAEVEIRSLIRKLG